MTHETAILLLVIAVGAVVSPSVGRRFGVPAAVVEIVFGVLVVALGVPEAETVPFVRFLADLGFALFLFLAGMELDVAGLRLRGVRGMVGPVSGAIVSFVLAFVASWLLGWSPWMALALGATSVPLLLSIVREVGVAATPLGRSMVTMAATGEVVTVALVALAEVLVTADGVLSASGGVFRLAAVLVLVVVGIRLMAVLRWWFPERVRDLLGGDDASETGIRVGFGLTFAMIAAAAVAGVEPLLGAFVGGLMVSFAVEDKHLLEQKFAPMAYGFFVPVFFVDVGMRLDLHVLGSVENIPRILAVCALMLAVKLVPGLAWLVVGRPPREVAATSLLLAAPLTLVIAIADLAGRLGEIDGATEAVLVVAGMLASLAFPTLARRLLLS